ncbi:MAG: anhydro-N-acetylmuramic acid kinase [Gemmatimonadaceae bacterium]|nr:anhydro-N-acetylmuramic acid kinase [Gemmatimonadaceae bacterium]
METRTLIGLMSGTSLDGISAAVVRFRGYDPVAFELLAFTSTSYTREERERLSRALNGTTAAEYCRINFDLGEWLSKAAMQAHAESGVPRGDIAAIASHGQTIWHEAGHSTWQTGETAVIAERTGIPVISDFRVRDVAAGGHGAPLVPIADALLFSSQSDWRALQNIGGIGNVTVVPPGGDVTGVRAFDTGPGVAVIDGVTRTLRPDLPYDVDGMLANAGKPSTDVVAELLQNPYFSAPPPKSTGRELFSAQYIESFIKRCRHNPGCRDEDIIATAVELTAASIGDAYRRFMPEPVAEILISGGGAKNPALVTALRRHLEGKSVRPFDDVFFDGEAKEAVAFALLGYLHLIRQPGNVPGATGARGPRILGKYTPA